MYNGINELMNASQDRRNASMTLKDYNQQAVATAQNDLAIVIHDLTKYTLMLNQRNTLQYEGFLIEKIDYCIALLNNTKGRINLARSNDELI